VSKHVVVWIDHKEARIFSLHPEGSEEATVVAPLHNIHHKHPRGQEGEKDHPDDAKRSFHEVVRGLERAEAVLLVGPGTAKLHFFRYVHKHEHALEPKVVGIETVDHPTDGQAVAYARKYFKRSERMQ
jgi:stalled ribosome rescue protein Dom34